VSKRVRGGRVWKRGERKKGLGEGTLISFGRRSGIQKESQLGKIRRTLSVGLREVK